MSDRFLRKSKCIGSWLHRFKIEKELPSGVLEVCEICHKKMFFKILNGKVNNLIYMDYHIRDALPKHHPLYFHEYQYNPEEQGIISPYQNV